jgi:hypothetical protein
LVAEGRILVHFDPDHISVYHDLSGALTLLGRQSLALDDNLLSQTSLDAIAEFCDGLKEFAESVDSANVRLYATGRFQRLSQQEAARLVILVYVDTGLYLNIVSPELERFYFEVARSGSGVDDMMEGLIRHEFRQVVVCGSFQESLTYIEDVVARLRASGATVLSPASTRVKPETAGTDFILFDYQDYLKNARDTWRHKYEHMDKFRQADAIVICNPGGRVGKGTLFELGFMCAVSTRVIFTEEPVGISVLFPYEIGLRV